MLRGVDELTRSHIGQSDDLANPLIRRLELFAPLSTADRDVLIKAVANTRSVPAQTDLVREGDPPKYVHVVLEGFACRYKIVEGGRRQIVTFLVPGDVCDAHIFILDRMDHSIATLSDTKVAVISRDVVETVFEHHPAIMKALLWSSLVNESIAREWLANMGRRSPDKRIGHLLCEMLTRLKIAGLASHDRFAFPVTQADLGDTVGLSTVHVNRTLQELKEKKLIASKRWLFEVLDLERLEEFSDFDPSYLHCSRASD
jgi:CRP-like cAMP-binding protein